MNLGKSLRMAIAIHNVRHSAVAKAAGVSNGYISGIKSGKANPTSDIIERIAKDGFGMKVSEFIALGE